MTLKAIRDLVIHPGLIKPAREVLVPVSGSQHRCQVRWGDGRAVNGDSPSQGAGPDGNKHLCLDASPPPAGHRGLAGPLSGAAGPADTSGLVAPASASGVPSPRSRPGQKVVAQRRCHVGSTTGSTGIISDLQIHGKSRNHPPLGRGGWVSDFLGPAAACAHCGLESSLKLPITSLVRGKEGVHVSSELLAAGHIWQVLRPQQLGRGQTREEVSPLPLDEGAEGWAGAALRRSHVASLDQCCIPFKVRATEHPCWRSLGLCGAQPPPFTQGNEGWRWPRPAGAQASRVSWAGLLVVAAAPREAGVSPGWG